MEVVARDAIKPPFSYDALAVLIDLLACVETIIIYNISIKKYTA
jgi:hypothetical protein